MNDKRKSPDESMVKGRKRVAPTIDLTATEIPQTQAAETTPGAPVEDPPPQDPIPQEPPSEPPATPVEEPGVSDPPVGEPPLEDPTPEPQGSESIAAMTPDSAAVEPRSRGPSMMALIAAGFVGAALMSAAIVGLSLSGLLPIRYAGSTATRARVAALEMQVKDLQSKPAGTAQPVDTKAVDTLTQRVATMEDAIKNLPKASAATDPALIQRIDAADNAMKSLGVALTALNRRSDEVAGKATQAQQQAEAADKAVTDMRTNLQDVSKTANAGASSADLAPLQQRIAALEQQAKTATAELSKATAADQSARLALSAASLRDTVLRGAPYGDALAQAKALGGDDKQLAPLQPFASSGVPSEQALAKELAALLPALRKDIAPPPSGNFLDRLQANAAQLVRVRPLDAPAGDDPSAVLARLDADAAQADIAAALSDLGKLTEAQRAPAQAWIAKAKDRQAALAAARTFAADTARSLGSR